MIPEKVQNVITALVEGGFQAYLIGGCVRDLLLNRTPGDWDVATDAVPAQVMDTFPQSVPSGIKYGTVLIEGTPIVEITTFRREGPYSDGRRPDTVEFSRSLEEDVSRRDFTVNGLAMSTTGRVIDHVRGLEDLKARVIRAIGDPDQRFDEDALRLIRAVRFVSQLGFTVEPETLKAIHRKADSIQRVAAERVREEFSKILLSPRPGDGVRLLGTTGLLRSIIPELYACKSFDQDSKYHDKDVFEHLLKTTDAVPPILPLRLAALFHDIAKPLTRTEGKQQGESHYYGHDKKGADMTKDILTRLRFDKKTTLTTASLVREHMSRFAAPGKKLIGVKRLINRVGEENLPLLFSLQEADILASAPPHDRSTLVRMKKAIDQVLSEKQPRQIKDLAVNGKDLLAWGVEPGPQVGLILNSMVELVLSDPSRNTKAALYSHYLSMTETKS